MATSALRPLAWPGSERDELQPSCVRSDESWPAFGHDVG